MEVAKGGLVEDAVCACDTKLAEESETAVPLDTPHSLIASKVDANIFDVKTALVRGGEASDTDGSGTIIERTCEDRGANSGRATFDLIDRDEVVHVDRYATVRGYL